MKLKLFISVWVLSAPVFAAESPFIKSASDTAAFDTIAGDLPPVLMAKKHPYYVAGDIYVPQGKTVTISAGAVLCFKNFTSLHVSGTLLAKGAKDMPVVFTSENDKVFNKSSTVDAAPYDWNGIYIHEDGIGTQLLFCAVQYSVDGISSLTKFFKLAPCVFLHNGRASLTIEGAIQPVTEKPYEYSLSINDVSAGGVPIALLRDPFASSRKTLRFSGVVTAGIGIAAVLGCSVHLGSTQKSFSSISGSDKSNLVNNSSTTWTTARTKRNRDIAALIAGVGLAAIGTVGIFWSFRF
jgi:hypothetical protein